MASGWNLWMWLQCIGVVSGCCREIYRLLHISYLYSTCISFFGSCIPTSLFINPPRACTARVIVVVLYVCMYVCPLISAASHIGITKERYHRIHRNTGIVLYFADFPKIALFKSFGVICLPRAAPAS